MKINYMEDELSKLNYFRKNKIKLITKNTQRGSVPGAYSHIDSGTIIVEPGLIEILNKEELKALLFHEYSHFLEDVPGNWFWKYFVIKYLFLMYICSFSFSWDYNIYMVLGLVTFGFIFYTIYKSRKESKEAQDVEYKCDYYAANNTSKDTVISLLRKIEESNNKEELNLDKYLADKILGRYHPSFNERINKINQVS